MSDDETRLHLPRGLRAVCLAAVVALALAGCGEGENGDDDEAAGDGEATMEEPAADEEDDD